MTDLLDPARAVADAVLHEGEVLYPYRASSDKNRVRFQFGVLVPRAQTAHDPSERSRLTCELLVEGRDPLVRMVARALRLRPRRATSSPSDARASLDQVTASDAAASLDEAVVEELVLFDVPLSSLEPGWAGTRAVGLSAASGGAPLTVSVTAGAALVHEPFGLRKLSVSLENVTDWCMAGARRDEVLRHSLVSVHLLAGVRGGRFISLIDPPAFAADGAAACANDGTYPVLASPADDVVLAAPIILYDHPQVAPESLTEFCDATEIDEMLALRVLTLTDEEKAEARATDPRTAELVALCEALPEEVLGRLHGAVRSLRTLDTPSADPATDTVRVPGGVAAKGATVRLLPRRRADAQDTFVAGRLGTVTGVFRDVDGGCHVAVVVADDPAAELHEWYGRYLYFSPDEVELVSAAPDRLS